MSSKTPEPQVEANPDDWESPPISVRPATPSSSRVRGSEPPRGDELSAGTVVGGRYEVRGVLGKGGFGVVYDALHVELKNPIALKVLHRRLTEDESLFSRFQQEARSSAAIGHPNIVQVFDLGVDEHGAYIAMEKLEGEELADRIEREHPLSEAFVAKVGAEVADAIAAAHENGVVHRDLKPQNVFLAKVGRREDVPKVIDFGIAKLLHRVEGDLTATGQLFGTPRFMAPEQLRGSKNVDARVDVYALGALLYRTLTGAYPYDGETYPELLLQIMSDVPPAISRFRPDVTARMTEIITKAMEKRPEDRFSSAAELAEALHAHGEVAPTDAPTDLPDPVVTRDPFEERTGPLSQEIQSEPPDSAPPVPEKRASPALWVALGVGGVLAIAAGGYALYDVGASAPEEEGALVQVPPTADPEPAPEPEPEPEPAPEPAPAEPVTVHVESDPPGAHVRVAGALVCDAPCDPVVAELPALFTAELDGYETTERFVPNPAPATVRFVLPRRRGGTSPSTRRSGRRSAPTTDPGSTGPAPPPLLNR